MTTYLLGDSTDSGLQLNYLDLTKEVVECAVVLVEAELELATTIDKRRTAETERAAVIKAVEEFGQRATALVAPVAKEQANTPVGRCAAAIAASIRDNIDREAATARAALAGDLEELDRADRKVRARNRDVLEKLLRAHDLPEAEKTYEIVWSGSTVKATVRERTTFGVEAVLALDLPANTVLTPDLRVDRLVDGVEIHAVEAGGWLKKGDKLVPHKLGRYVITRVAVQPAVTIRLQVTPEASSPGFTITVRGDEPMLVERHGDGTKEFQIEDQDKAKLVQLATRLGKEARELDAHRGNLVSVEIGGKPVAEHAHPRSLAELLINTIAPTIRKIAKHSRSPGELVLRRPLGGNRREELFLATGDLIQFFKHLPEAARDVFAPLELDGKPYVAKAAPAPAAAPAAPAATETAAVATPAAPTRSRPITNTKPPVLTAPLLGGQRPVPPESAPASSGPMPVVKTAEPAQPAASATAPDDDEAWEAPAGDRQR